MRNRWGLLLIPPLFFTGGLLIVSQLVFLESSLHLDEGLGRVGDAFTLENYRQLWRDPYYLDSLLLTFKLSAGVTAAILLLAWPAAYVISRASTWLAITSVVAIIAASFVTLPIKALGMIILFSAEGPLMSALRAIGLIDARARFIGSPVAVAVGYMHLAITFMVVMLFSVLQSVPRRLEEAAIIHGASRWRAIWRVVLPLSLPGTVSVSLLTFNLLAGAFVSAALLGGGKVLTLPVLTQRSLILFTEYGMAATLAAVLLISVIAVNVASVIVATRLTRGVRVIA